MSAPGVLVTVMPAASITAKSMWLMPVPKLAMDFKDSPSRPQSHPHQCGQETVGTSTWAFLTPYFPQFPNSSDRLSIFHGPLTMHHLARSYSGQ